jgi:hypothetical protein
MFYAVKTASCERQGVKSGRSAADQACCKKPDERQPKPPTWRVSSFAFVSLAFFCPIPSAFSFLRWPVCLI